MDSGRHSRAREKNSSGGYTMDLTSSFHRSKRPRSEDPPSEEEKESSVFKPSAGSSMDISLTSASSTTSPWRLPANQTLVDNQKYLNEQLQHVVALSSMLGARSSGLENGTRRFLAKEKAAEDDVDKVCTLDLAKVWRLLSVGMTQQTEEQMRAESGVREVMDLVSYLLYVRDRELDRQNRLSENLGRVEKQLERKNHIVQTLTTDLETLKQNFAQKENVLKAKEKSLLAERKTLQVEKKALEVNCARLQGVETAYKAQLRRKDVDYARLKKSLQDAVARAAKEKRGMAIAKTLNGLRERKQASTTKQSKESKLTKQIMDNLERKKAELLLDNEALAKSYDALQHHLESLTSQYKKAVQLFLAQKNLEGDAEELEKLARAPIDDFTPTPFNMATKESIPQYISASMEALDGKLKQLEHVIRNELPSAEARSDREVIKRLRRKLDDAHAIIKEQDQLLQASLSSPAADVRVKKKRDGLTKLVVDKVGARSSPNVAFEEEMAQEKSELAVLRQNLEKERRLLQEQAVKLDKDRLEFEIGKRDEMFFTPDDAMLSSSSTSCLTPKRQRRSKRFDLDSPIDMPVSATPGTAALLKKIGIKVPTKK
ncbi:Afadin- and alpha-actinin-binding domain-containing protein [Phytophthora infestans]|uniref:Afadin- and alpha-actinin-binding domain-containing protein n=1 Tax=Phytophthora infestans TaxID=4787 RepID=A0A833T4N5_PHYIN|nr:Afadin- and alpha-actinin-binding domain-containing protein [Phytophthora infestans]